MKLVFTQKPVGLAVFGLIFAGVVSLYTGVSDLDTGQIVRAFLYGGEHDFVVNHYRLPRLVLAMLVGTGLGLSGVLVQGVIRNPLASPDLMGISAGAGLAATSLLVIFPQAPLWALPVVAIVGGLLAAMMIYATAMLTKPTPARLALTGVAISAFLSSGIDFLLIVHPIEVNTAMVWLTGSLWGRNWQQFPLLFAAVCLLIPVAFWLAWRLDVLGSGELIARGLGVHVTQVQVLALIVSVVLASVSVSVAGTISFVGLLSPHLARLLVGSKHHILIPMAALIGAILVLVSDILARGLIPPTEFPAGVITSVIGAPYFIYLLSRYKGW
ncbi:iron chelate uptake ABC transporter family permease subunit [Photobacterium sp. CAU 1568]|uniref:Iron chelate uptake ABC transporter family permease subunit n=1 Tax=Photobacterium arenosum TaxID=2774143 RepID=A0ABR9BQQ4_9GAMM|nr:iron chelate uptake ABC transporter family permease subunit [Photobacterium arenosum]MBD8513950.1 iron chelate uptake ABC transporter family permease subunit [Photobacterium arenosum]